VPSTSALTSWSEFASNGALRGDRTVSVNDHSATFSRYFTGSQVTDSESHPYWRHRKRGTFSGDLGGPFLTVKRYLTGVNTQPVTLTGKVFNGFNAFDLAVYTGPMLPLAPGEMQFAPDSSSSDEKLIELGTTAIAKCAPANPITDLSTFLGEIITEGLPRVKKLAWLRNLSSKERLKALADDFLNYEFGWKPLVSDVSDLSNAFIRADTTWAQYERDAGKLVRRRFSFPDETSSSTATFNEVNPWIAQSSGLLYDNFVTPGKVIRNDLITKKRWFSGAFTYYLPSDRGRVGESVIKAKKILGLTITPDVVWNLAPWSWAVDWFTNTGDVLANWSSWLVDGQVLVYGYMMEETIVERTYSFSGPTGFRTSAIVPGYVKFVTHTKKRIAASPYGFGLTWDGLSAVQKAIIAALGITKGLR
jgi:hypothetical protein